MSYYIGIDLGTSSVKLLLVDGQGVIVRIASEDYPLTFPRPGWSEQHPADWWNAVVRALRTLTDGIDPHAVRAVAVGGQMHGLVALDASGGVIRPAILWNDGRTSEETAYLNDTIGRETLNRLTGNIAFAGFTAPKLLWMRAHEPDNFSRIAHILLPKDYVNYRLTGVHASDYSDASGTLLLDVKHKAWSSEMARVCGVMPAQLPTLHESADVIGTLTPDAAAATGLPAGIPVMAGAGDNAAAAVGTGTVGEGGCNLSLGTSGTLFVSGTAFRKDPSGAIHAFAHADGGFHLMACMLSAASCNQWLCGDILRTDDYAGEQSAVSHDMLGENRVYFLPYLMGERSPINDTSARGTLVGMTMNTTRAEIVQAVLEGVAFALRDSLEAMRTFGVEVRESRICGGGAKSPLWRKILANVLGIPLHTVVTEQGPGYGAAILAMVGSGLYPSVRAASDALVRVAGSTLPDPALAEKYNARYQAFQTLYPALKPVFPKL
ncbi:MAG: xylulokinase [Clostridiales bacterium]|nr:xylulokinase [Clostridiales bacterium]